MVNAVSRTWLPGAWILVLVFVVGLSRSMDASLSTTILLAALVVAPGIVIALLKGGAPSRSVTEILRAAHAKDGRL